MKCIVYVSRSAVPFDDHSLAGLADFASQRNADIGVTGYLYYADGKFTQYIEGDAEPLERLYSSIRADPRHRVIGDISDENLAGRRFPAWGMRWLRPYELKEIDIEHLLTDHFLFIQRVGGPETVGAVALWRLVEALAGQARRLAASA